MNTQEILSANFTKTEKIRRLLELGLTRRQVADLTGGNYGFVQNVFAKYWPENVNGREFRFIAFNRKFGVEIEAYGVEMQRVENALRSAGIYAETERYNHSTRRHWKLVTDGSLTGVNTFELVSPILEGMSGLNELEKVCEVLETLNVKINKTCGLHIHFDATQMGLQQTKNLLLNYAKLEEAIDSFMPHSRRGNNNSYTRTLRGHETKIENADSISKIASGFGSRYFKVNMQAYERHRTIEFRQHSGTVEFKKISNWVIFLHNLVEYSKTKRVETTTFETLKKFNQAEVYNYLVTRQNQLAA
ncbi:amidoligase family protein [Runella sp. SP2]|uniref:amidoligase family protein n=1 Tax=Runella sp. SP2 TaxID=2268026 RepID=UPI000F07CC45|nr:amidoligase family protein [Runella sp. SP2]AYQ31402.1 amidoligase enzyme [Runella sp. SP2]